MRTDSQQRCDRQRWIRWRAARLRSAGFLRPAADALARQERIDLHAVLDLIDRGCPPHLAARILAPLDPPGSGDEPARW